VKRTLSFLTIFCLSLQGCASACDQCQLSSMLVNYPYLPQWTALLAAWLIIIVAVKQWGGLLDQPALKFMWNSAIVFMICLVANFSILMGMLYLIAPFLVAGWWLVFFVVTCHRALKGPRAEKITAVVNVIFLALFLLTAQHVAGEASRGGISYSLGQALPGTSIAQMLRQKVLKEKLLTPREIQDLAKHGNTTARCNAAQIMKSSGNAIYVPFLVDWLEKLESGRPGTGEQGSVEDALQSLTGTRDRKTAKEWRAWMKAHPR